MNDSDKISLTLENFRCWKYLNLNFMKNQLTLLKGKMGSGKTTIFQAINWILFGNVKKVHPLKSKSAKTRGILDFGDLIVERQKSPNLIKVIIGDKMYDDKAAQSIINEKFGDPDVWLASCYIKQECRNSFLTSSNIGKIDLLNKIAFPGQDPSEFKEKIDNLIIENNKEYELLLKSYNGLNDLFCNKWGDFDFENIVDENEIIKYNEEISILKQNKIQLHEIQSLRKIKLQELQNINSQIQKCKNIAIKLPECPKLIEDIIDIENVDDYISEISNYIPQIKNLKELKDQLDDIEDIEFDKSLLERKRKELIDVSQNEICYQNNLKLAKSLNVAYDYDCVEKKLDEYIDLVDSQKLLNLKKKLLEYKNELSSIKIINLNDPNPNNELLEYKEIQKPDTSHMNSSIEQIQNDVNQYITDKSILEQKIKGFQQEIEKSKTALNCPHCGKHVKYISGKIHPFEITLPEDTNEQIKVMNNEISILTDKIKDAKNQIQLIKDQEKQIIKQWELQNKIERDRVSELNKKIYEYNIHLQKISQLQTTKDKLLNKIKNTEEEIKANKFEFNNTKILTQKEIDHYNSIITKMETIVFIEMTTTSQQIREEINKMERQLDKNQLLSQIASIEIPDKYSKYLADDLIKYRNQLQSWSKEYHKCVNLIENNNAKINELLQNLDNIHIPDDPSSDIINIENEIIEYKKMIDLNNNKILAKTDHENLIEMRNSIDMKTIDLANLRTIKKYSIDCECEILQCAVDSINTSIAEVCSSIFDEDINVELSMTKELKSGKTKQQVNMAINYKGGMFDSIEELSGGEKVKVSLSLTLALNNISNCPFLLLDEPLASFDPESKEMGSKLIKDNSMSKTVLCISHEEFNDVYDDVIDIQQIPKMKKKEPTKIKNERPKRVRKTKTTQDGKND